MYQNPFCENMTYPEARTVFFTVVEQYRGTPEMKQLQSDYKQFARMAMRRETGEIRPVLTNGMK